MEPVRAAGSPLTAAMGAGAAFGAIACACLAHFEANRAGMLAGDDPEYLHQGRVALRRLRTAIALFAPVLDDGPRLRARQDLRRLLRELGPARDWDVFVAFTVAPALAAAPGNRGLDSLARKSERRRRLARERARRAVRAQAPSKFKGELAALASSAEPAHRPVRRYAREVLARCARRVRRRGKGIRSLDAARLHRLRMAVKRLRYALHYFSPLFPKRRVAAMREALESLQHALGDINDCAVAGSLLRKLRVKPGAGIARRNAGKLAGHRRELLAAWKVFKAAEEGWE